MRPISLPWLQAQQTLNHDFNIVDDVAISLRDGECPEFFGDELAMWCRRHGFRARRMERSRLDVVKFGFESFEAAATFRQACGFPSE